MAAHQAPLSMGFSRQEHWSGLPFPPPMDESEKSKWSCSVTYPLIPNSEWIIGTDVIKKLQDTGEDKISLAVHIILWERQNWYHCHYSPWAVKCYIFIPWDQVYSCKFHRIYSVLLIWELFLEICPFHLCFQIHWHKIVIEVAVVMASQWFLFDNVLKK